MKKYSFGEQTGKPLRQPSKRHSRWTLGGPASDTTPTHLRSFWGTKIIKIDIAPLALTVNEPRSTQAVHR